MDISVLSKQKKFYPAKEIPFLSFLYVNKAEAKREREREREREKKATSVLGWGSVTHPFL